MRAIANARRPARDQSIAMLNGEHPLQLLLRLQLLKTYLVTDLVFRRRCSAASDVLRLITEGTQTPI
jgi:hypothetical protein